MFRSMSKRGSRAGSGSMQRRAAIFTVVSVAASMLAVAAPGPLSPLAPSAGAITSSQSITNSCDTWQTFTVPDGFVSAGVVLTGGGAGSGGTEQGDGGIGRDADSGPGGGGGIVTTTITTANGVSAGDSLALLLGCGGGAGSQGTTMAPGGNSNYGAGGQGGGRNPSGGGGGGASALCKGSAGCSTPLVVAGGGGGGGAAWACCILTYVPGLYGGAGAGGHITFSDTDPNGENGQSMSGNEGGRGATQAAPGGKGTGDDDGNPGTGTNGGWGVNPDNRTGGGGGGGGYKGGGSGASDNGTAQERGGGGGGGSSYSVASATYGRVTTKSTSCGQAQSSSNCGFNGKGGEIQYSSGNGYAGSAGTATITWTTKHTTSTTISCNPARVPYQVATTCTVIVTDTKPSPVTPSGTVTFSKTEGTGTETPSPNGSCTLGGSGASASCTFTYSSNTTDTYRFNASYGGGPDHFASGPATGSFSVTNRNTQITGTCSPNPVATGSTTTCTFTVTDTDTAGTKVSPLGPVSVTVASGASPQSSTCSLAASGPGVSTCPIVFNSGPPNTPLKVISMSFQGGTGGDRHRSSSGFTSFNVTGTPVGARHPTTSTMTCSASVPVNSSNLCEATVVDNATSGATSPTGVVMFYTSGGASPNQATCSLNAINPTTSKCSVSITALAPAGNKATRIHYFGSIVHNTSATVNSLIWQAT